MAKSMNEVCKILMCIDIDSYLKIIGVLQDDMSLSGKYQVMVDGGMNDVDTLNELFPGVNLNEGSLDG